MIFNAVLLNFPSVVHCCSLYVTTFSLWLQLYNLELASWSMLPTLIKYLLDDLKFCQKSILVCPLRLNNIYLATVCYTYTGNIFTPFPFIFFLKALSGRDNGAGSCGHRKSVQSVVHIYEKYMPKWMHLPPFCLFICW